MSDEEEQTQQQQQQAMAESTSTDTSKPASSSSSSPSQTPAPSASEASSAIVDGKVVVMFKHTGNAPPMKQKVFKLNATSPWKTVSNFLRKQLKYKDTEPLFLFINSTFQPSPDEVVADLAKCFHNNGKLIVNYCTTAAWG